MTDDEVIAQAKERLRSLSCGDNSCIIRRPTGMATNGGCGCFGKLAGGWDFATQHKATAAIQWWRVLAMALARKHGETL